MKNLNVMVTLWPSFPHFRKFVWDNRLSGIRLNSAMMTAANLETELPLIPSDAVVPLYFDIKGRQLRVTEVNPSDTHLDIVINHEIEVETPTPVLFKAGADVALLDRVENGRRLIFASGREHGPVNQVRAGESLHIRHPSLVTKGEQFTPIERDKIERVKAAGFTRWFLSYVQSKQDVDEFLELIGSHEEVILKIEDKKGLEYVARDFKKRNTLRLCAAKGDLYVELDMPHDILAAQKLILAKDPAALAGSRMMLSIVNGPVPENADFEQLAWLYDIGYRNLMLCDEICLKGELLGPALNAVMAFKEVYAEEEFILPTLIERIFGRR